MIQDIDGHEAQEDAERVAAAEKCVAEWINGEGYCGYTQRDIADEFVTESPAEHFTDYRYRRAWELVGE